ncbi:MAG: sialate O-acetylesterase [Bacilli bacterium]|nr:sialate O-acetylesterase [Bacilli bacterium]
MKLRNYIGNNTVLQQNSQFTIDCFSDFKILDSFLYNEKEDIKVQCQTIYELVRHHYKLTFNAPKGSYNSYKLVIKNEKEELIQDGIFFGDVYLFMGQSNMSYGLRALEKSEYYKKEVEKHMVFALQINEAKYDSEGNILRPFMEMEDIDEKFKFERISSSNCLDYSGLTIETLVNLSKKVNYPVAGIINAIGGVSIDAFICREEILHDEKVLKFLKDTGKFIEKPRKNFNTFKFANYTQMSGLYNEKVYPFKDLKFAGVIYYQGENSAYDFYRGENFYYMLSLLINSYRKLFNDKNMPFYLVSISDEYYDYGDGYGYFYINEAMLKVQMDIENTYLIPIYDIDSRWLKEDSIDLYFHPIHPINKEEISLRIVDTILNSKTKKQYHFPFISSFYEKDNKLYLLINSEEKLDIGAYFEGFTIGNEDGYKVAKAIVKNDRVIELSNKNVLNPTCFTYAFSQYPIYCNCKTIDGLPLLPQRSNYEAINHKYLMNQIILSCDYLGIRENNFGYEVAGGFYRPFFENGTLIDSKKCNISLSKRIKTEGKAAIRFKLNPIRNINYNYSSLKINIGFAGLKHYLKDYNYLLVDVLGNENIEFHGILTHINGSIIKFPIVVKDEIKQFVKLENSFKRYTINLKKYLLGSEELHYSNDNLLDSIVSFELYFRSNSSETVFIDNLELSNYPYEINYIDKEKTEKIDESIIIMKGN